MTAELNLEVCASSALDLVTILNRRGVNATVLLDDISLALFIPPYGTLTAPIERRAEVHGTIEDCHALLEPLHEAIKYLDSLGFREKRMMSVLDGLSYDDLKILADDPDIKSHLQNAIVRNIMKPNSPEIAL